MTIRRGNNILGQPWGLYLGMPNSRRPPFSFKDCLNVRIKNARTMFENMGWAPFPNSDDALNLDNKPALLISDFVLRDGTEETVFGNTTDLFVFDSINNELDYITPRYETGTISVNDASTSVTGSGTSWATEAKAGDFISFGATGVTDPAATWYEIDSVGSDTSITLAAAYSGSNLAGEPYTIRQTFTGDITNFWFTETFYNADDLTFGSTQGDRWYACNGKDAVVAWDGSDDQVYEPNLGNVQSCQWMRRYKNRMVYVAPTISGTLEKYKIRSSDIGKPEDTVNGEAAELIVHDGPDELLAAEVLGELLVLYAEKTVVLAQAVGLPLIFAFRAAVNQYGPVAARAISVYPDFHDFVGDDRMYRFNGATATAVDDHVWREILRTFTPERSEMFQTHFDEENGDLLHLVPVTTDEATSADSSPEQSWTRHYMEIMPEGVPQPYTRRELPALCFGKYRRNSGLRWFEVTEQWQQFNYQWNDRYFATRFPLTLFGDQEGNIFVLNGDTVKNDVLMDSYVHYARVPVGTVEMYGVVRRIYPYIEQISGSEDSLTVTLYGAKTVEGDAEVLSEQSFAMAIATSSHFVSPRQSTRFAEVEIGFEAERFFYSVMGYGIDTVPGGRR